MTDGLRKSRMPMRRMLCVAALPVIMAGCTVTPRPLSAPEVAKRVEADQQKMFQAQETIDHAITFEEAVALSLKYNLDYRLKLMESALSVQLLNVSKHDMLPDLVVSSGYTQRNNLTGSRSFLINPDGSTSDTDNYSGGVEKQRWTAGADLSWSVLDFGLSYYNAKQKADAVLIAEERRRRVVQAILQDVRSAYWRALGAQRLAGEAERLTVRVRSALERSRAAEAQGLMAPREALEYQRMLLEAMNLLATRRQELDLAKRELAALMNTPPGKDFTLAEVEEPALPGVPTNLAELENLALLNRPELREEDYRLRITSTEARKNLLQILPNLNFGIGQNYDSNSYLYNNNWLEASSKVTFNLVKVFTLGSQRRANEAQKTVDDARRMAQSMAILTQLRVAIERYRMALRDLERAKESTLVDQRLAAYARAAESSRVNTELETIRAETRALNTQFQRYAAYAAAQAAFGRIYATLGLDVMPPDVENGSVEKLAAEIGSYVSAIEKKNFPALGVAEEHKPKIALVFGPATEVAAGVVRAYPLSAEAKATMMRNVNVALGRNDIAVTTPAASDYELTVNLVMNPTQNGTRRGEVRVVLRNKSGAIIGESRYSSALSPAPSVSSLAAFSEAAVISNLRQIRQWTEPHND